MQIIFVGIGGFFGAISRYMIDRFIIAVHGGSFPLGILLINVSGSFMLGFFYAATIDRFNVSSDLKLVVTIGFLGAYTTFATLSHDTVRLLENGAVGHAFLNMSASLIGGLLAIYLGMMLAKAI